jgi:hypothetical protein
VQLKETMYNTKLNITNSVSPWSHTPPPTTMAKK